MRTTFHSLLVLIAVFAAAVAKPVQAAPITSGGPGGFAASSNQAASNLRLWLKADSINQSPGTLITTWEDSSFYGAHAEAPLANRPTLITAAGINNQAAVQFSGSQHLDLTSGHDMLREVAGTTLFQVVQTNATSVQRTVFVSTPTAAATRAGLNLFDASGTRLGSTTGNFGVAGRRLDANGYQRLEAGTTVAGPTAPFYLHGGSLNYATATASLFVNGEVLATHTPFQSAGNSSDSDSANIRIGGNAGGTGDRLNGHLAEVLIFNKVLNDAERILVENYLSSKYDLPLDPSVNFYAGDTAANGNYDFDVFGIGRVGAGHEVLEAGSAGLGLKAASLSDGSWVLAGRNANNVNSLTGDDLAGTGLAMRMARDYYIDATSVADEIQISFNLADAGLPLSAADLLDPSLLFRSSQTGDYSVLDVLQVFDGDTITFFVPAGMLQSGFYTLGMGVPEPSSLVLLGLGLAGAKFRPRRRRREARGR